MATPAYLSVRGEHSRLMTEGAYTVASVGTSQKDHENEVLIQAFSHEVTLPYDPQSGTATGQRVHKPIVITKVFDKSSPLLLAALCSAEKITELKIRWYRTDSYGNQEHYYTTTLEGAQIVHIKDYMHNFQDPANAHYTQLQDVHFSYTKITWEHVVANTSGSDDWREQKTG